MRFAAFVLVAVLCLSMTGVAQDVIPSVGAGSKAILFDFSGLSFIGAGAYEGGIGVKYYLSSDMALRGGIQFTSASDKNPANPGTGQVGADGSTSATEFGVSAALEFRLAKGRVSPFVGVGASFGVASTESKNAAVATPPAVPTQTTVKNRASGENINGITYLGGTKIGAFGILGVEFFLYKELSLGAEYRLGFMSLSQKDQEITSGTTTTTTKQGSTSSIGITNSGVVTLAVYF